MSEVERYIHVVGLLVNSAILANDELDSELSRMAADVQRQTQQFADALNVDSTKLAADVYYEYIKMNRVRL